MCRRVFHWGPLLALGIIKWISISTVYCISLWWPPQSSLGGLFHFGVFLALSSLTTFHFLCAMFEGPGYLPLEWKPEKEEDIRYLQYCQSCQGYKAPRAHHCRKCGKCVMKMDHHCPWINNCVGHLNHGHFIAFLTFAVLGSVQASFSLSMFLYYGINMSWFMYYGTGTEPVVILTVWMLLIVMFALGLAVGVIFAVGALLFFQLRAVCRNQTGIEDWIIEKAVYRLKGSQKTFHNPYSLGYWKNLQQVLSFSCAPKGDGINWTLAEGAGKYDLTIEQLEQKTEKRLRTREYLILKPYSGSWFPIWSQGLAVSCRPPCTDEPRISLIRGDIVKVTRWKKYWLYGDKVVNNGRSRGWFPRNCAAEMFKNESNQTKKDQ